MAYQYYNKPESVVPEIRNDIKELTNRIDSVTLKLDKMETQIDTINRMHPWKQLRTGGSKKISASWSCPATFLGFLLYTPVDVRIDSTLYTALANYNGPESVINSLRRSWKGKSKHNVGKAVDMGLTNDLVEYLISEEGEKWLKDHNLKYFIEGKPGSRVVSSYTKDPRTSRFVKFNPDATGDHIHMHIV
jgi:hypothetical protein